MIGKYGRTPKAAVEIELRQNPDGTLTPFADRYAMVDFESGEPLVLPADITDAQAAKAIRDAGVLTTKDKFYGVKEDPAAPAAPATAPEAASPAPAPAAAERPTAEAIAAARARLDGLKALLGCLQS